jgi:hypothetical protein
VLNVDLPDCYTQVDLIFGGKDEIIDPLDGTKFYGNKILGSNGAPGNRSKGPRGGWNGGDKSCTQPAAEFVSNCDGTVDVHLSNSGKYPTAFEVTTGGGFNKSVSVAPGESETVRVPLDSAFEIRVTSEGREVATGGWERPQGCPQPTLVAKSDCDTLTLRVNNPKGNAPAKVNVTYGTDFRQLLIRPGESATAIFPASTAEVATAAFVGWGVGLEAVYAKPANCGGGGGGLPVTGAAVGGSVAAALLLLGVGAGLFLAARRRRIRFTA